MDRDVPSELFYDPEVVGLTVADEAAPTAPTGGAEVEGDDFFPKTGDPARGDLKVLLWRLASNPFTLALTMLGIGFFAVFVRQAPILYQIVLGAPIFEEFLKFGLALAIAYPLRLLALRLPVAFAVGAGFGWLEHVVTYSEEPQVVFIGRVLFHAGATALSMVAFHILESVREVRVRWFATLPATVLHYANNAGAVISLVLLPAAPETFDLIGYMISTTVLVGLYTIMVALPFWARGWRRWTFERVRSWVARGAAV